jgi:hypothetical protein
MGEVAYRSRNDSKTAVSQSRAWGGGTVHKFGNLAAHCTACRRLYRGPQRSKPLPESSLQLSWSEIFFFWQLASACPGREGSSHSVQFQGLPEAILSRLPSCLKSFAASWNGLISEETVTQQGLQTEFRFAKLGCKYLHLLSHLPRPLPSLNCFCQKFCHSSEKKKTPAIGCLMFSVSKEPSEALI